jgi:hypothetical protein
MRWKKTIDVMTDENAFAEGKNVVDIKINEWKDVKSECFPHTVCPIYHSLFFKYGIFIVFFWIFNFPIP